MNNKSLHPVFVEEAELEFDFPADEMRVKSSLMYPHDIIMGCILYDKERGCTDCVHKHRASTCLVSIHMRDIREARAKIIKEMFKAHSLNELAAICMTNYELIHQSITEKMVERGANVNDIIR